MIHVAVLLKPYLDSILDGSKTVECRLTRDARAPFDMIESGERIYFKQSAGPYRATAIADHVLFESGLTPRRVMQIKRDYGHLLHGADEYWRMKRNARFCTLIWLRDVEPISVGPEIGNLQGRAWEVFEEEPAWRRRDPGRRGDPGDGSFHVEITEGNLRHGSLYVTTVLEKFPRWTIGGATKADAARPITLMLHGGDTVETDIVGPRKLLRTRVWRRWFAEHGARAGDHVVFTPIDRRTFFVGLARAE
jgi:ASC-1-like (ASCH) protein